MTAGSLIFTLMAMLTISSNSWTLSNRTLQGLPQSLNWHNKSRPNTSGMVFERRSSGSVSCETVTSQEARVMRPRLQIEGHTACIKHDHNRRAAGVNASGAHATPWNGLHARLA